MPKFLSGHTMPAGARQREQLNQFARAARCDATVRPCRTFLDLSEGKVCFTMGTPRERGLSAWFHQMQMSCDHIMPVELKGERCGQNGLNNGVTESPVEQRSGGGPSGKVRVEGTVSEE